MSMSLTEKNIAKETAEQKLKEAKWWRHLVLMDEDSYFAVEGDKRIAELEKELNNFKY